MNTINPTHVPNSFFGANNELQVGKPLAEAVQADVKAHLDAIPDPAADQLFLKAIADLSPEAVDTAGERQALFAKFSEAAQKLASLGSPDRPAPGPLDQTSGPSGSALPYTGDIAKFLARAMIEFAGMQRQQAVEDRVLARQAAQAEMLNQAAQQEKAANEMMAGAITNAVLGGIGGALSFMGSASSFAGQAKGIKDMHSALKQSSSAQKTMDGLIDSASNSAQATKAANATKGARVDIDLPPAPGTRNRSDAFSLGSGNTVNGPPVPGAGAAKSTATGSDDAIAKLNQKDAALNSMTPEQSAQYRAAESQKGRADQEFMLNDKMAQAKMTRGQAIDALGGMLKTAGASSDGAMQATGKHSEAQGSRDAADAEYMKQVADGKKEIEEAMSEFMKQIINFIKEMQDAEVEAMRAITRG